MAILKFRMTSITLIQRSYYIQHKIQNDKPKDPRISISGSLDDSFVTKFDINSLIRIW